MGDGALSGAHSTGLESILVRNAGERRVRVSLHVLQSLAGHCSSIQGQYRAVQSSNEQYRAVNGEE